MRRLLPLFPVILALSLPCVAFAQAGPMESYWPHEDGRQWAYDQHYEQFFPNTETVDDIARLWFEGTTVAPVAIPAQYLRGEVTGIPAAPRGALAAPASVGDPFLRRLWEARPDLRTGILAAAEDSPCPVDGAAGWNTFMIYGEIAFFADAAEVGSWRCNADNTQQWRWLVADLTLGNTFSLQLVPDIANDVFLYGTVAAIEPVTVPAGTFAACLRVDYRIDYGVSTCLDDGGPNPIGTYRSETLGSVWYAPSVGPVKTHEEFTPYAEVLSGDCGFDPGQVGSVAAVATLELSQESSVPVEASTWSRIKASYGRP